MVCGYHVTKVSCAVYLGAEPFFCREQLLFRSFCRLRNFGPSASDCKCCAFSTPLLVEVLDEAAHESCLPELHLRWKLLRPPAVHRTSLGHSGRARDKSLRAKLSSPSSSRLRTRLREASFIVASSSYWPLRIKTSARNMFHRAFIGSRSPTGGLRIAYPFNPQSPGKRQYHTGEV